MKRAAVTLCVAISVTAIAGETTMTDDEQLHALHQQFAAAWSRGDAQAGSMFWTEDGVRVGAAGDVQHGRKDIEAALGRLLNGPFKGATVKLEKGTVRTLGPDLALYQGPMQIEPGGGRPVVKGYAVDVMKKVGGKWLILESHPKLFPSLPPPQK